MGHLEAVLNSFVPDMILKTFTCWYERLDCTKVNSTCRRATFEWRSLFAPVQLRLNFGYGGGCQDSVASFVPRRPSNSQSMVYLLHANVYTDRNSRGRLLWIWILWSGLALYFGTFFFTAFLLQLLRIDTDQQNSQEENNSLCSCINH